MNYTNIIPDKLINAAVYDGNSSLLLGESDVELPSLEYLSESLSGLGIAGEVETPVIGHFKTMTLKLKWNVINEPAIALLAPKTHHLEIRGSVQHHDAGTGDFLPRALKVVCRCMPKKKGLGKVEPGKKMDAETELEVVYLRVWLEGEELCEIDKLNFKCVLNGDDSLAKVRQDLGLA